jgi:hypothetical protein
MVEEDLKQHINSSKIDMSIMEVIESMISDRIE